ncbi:MAG: hypothetical protein NTY31_02250 [Candidatus Falkowbacteria bacterium]|nr:hypothetical protein [Candidatus Falkowbacteria bacterium]
METNDKDKLEIVEPLKTRTKAFLWIIGILLLALLVGIFLVVRRYQAKNTAKSTLIEVDKIYFENLKKDSQRLLDLRAEFERTNDALKMSTEQTILLQYELDKCRGIRRTVGTPSPASKPKAVVSADLTSQNNFRPPVKTTLNPPPVRTGGSIEGGMLNINQYGPAYQGDFCTTVQNGYLIYALSDTYWQRCLQKTISTPNIDGVAMNLNNSIGYWILISGTILTPETIINGKYRWSVGIGEFIGSGFRYDMYLPHESAKITMRSVLSREDGQVTQDEIGRMGQQDESIRLGLIGQNMNSVVGSDGKIYYGWEFVTPVNYTVKTN